MRTFFCYGTLMTNMSNHHVINKNHIESIEAATLKNMALYMHPCDRFPCMIEGKGVVIGQMITIKEEHIEEELRNMDALEGYRGEHHANRNMYNRKVKLIVLRDGSKRKAFTYLYNIKEDTILGSEIKTGNFKHHMKTTKRRK